MSNTKTALSGVAILIIAIALLCASALGIWAWRYYTAEPRGIANAERQIESAPSRITSYNHFYDLCASVQGYEGALLAQRAQLAAASGDEASRIRANIAGLQGQRYRAIAQYNADARKAYTRARFLGEDLPRQLDKNQENTVCAM